MIGLTLILVVAVSLLPLDAGLSRFRWNDLRIISRRKIAPHHSSGPETGQERRGKFSSLHSLGTWGAFYGTARTECANAPRL